MPMSSKVRREELLGATSFVSQTYPPYIHQMTPNINATWQRRFPPRMMDEHVGELGDRENEDQVEEQFQGGDPDLAALGPIGAIA